MAMFQENLFFGHKIEYKADSRQIDAILSAFQSEKRLKILSAFQTAKACIFMPTTPTNLECCKAMLASSHPVFNSSDQYLLILSNEPCLCIERKLIL